MKAALGGAAHGAADAALELLDVVFGWIVPLITLLVGFMLGGSIGLSGVIAQLLDGIMPPQVTPQTIAIIADLVAVAIWGAIAVGLWHAAGSFSKEGGKTKWAKYVMRPIATLFGGFALSELPALFKQGVNQGILSVTVAQAAAGAAKS